MTLNRIANVLKQTALRLGLVVALIVNSIFFLRAQAPVGNAAAGAKNESEEVIRVYFEYNIAKINRSYMSNPEAFARIAALVDAGTLNGAEVISYSSPEGDYGYNTRLSARRANAVQSYLLRHYPSLEGKVTVNPGTESWQKLRRDVTADDRLSSSIRSAIIDIIDSDAKPDEKERALKALPEYRSLYAHYFSALRYAEIVVKGGASEAQISSGSSNADVTGSASSNTNNSGEADVTGTTSSDADVTGNASNTPGETDVTGSAKGGSKVYFMVNDNEVRPAYLDNESNLLELRSILTNPAAKVNSITVVGTASPEGPEAHNEELAAARAQAMVDYITEIRPDLAGQISVEVKPENWDGLREAVLAEPSLSEEQKQEVIAIIDSNDSPDRKERHLRKTSAWRTIRRKILPVLRYSSIGNIEFTQAADTSKAGVDTTVVVTPADTTTITPADTTVTTTPADTTGNVVPQVDTTKTTPITGDNTPVIGGGEPAYKVRPMVMALKTNLLYDAVTALNFEVEVPIGKNFSIMAEDVFPWWETGNKYCFQMWEIGIEPRYWFNSWDVKSANKLQGFFVGPYLMSSKYDFQYDKSLNYQGEYWSAGVSAGYSKPISNLFNLEFSLSVGYMHTDYRHYMPTDDYSKLIRDPYNVGSVSYFGPTKAKISLVMPLPFNTKRLEVR